MVVQHDLVRDVVPTPHRPSRSGARPCGPPLAMRALLRRLLVDDTESTLLQLLRYALVGGCAAVVDIGSFTAFTVWLGLDYRFGVFLAFSLGTATNFTLSNAFVFNRRSLPLRVAFVRHYVSSLGGLLVNELVMIFWVEALDQDQLLLGKVIATGIAFVVNFTLIKMYAFNHRISLFRRLFKGDHT
jgi:putative flippase GtrA